jgi:hypothetical protein
VDELASTSAIQDLAGNPANLSAAGANLGLKVNTTNSDAAGSSTGNFMIGGTTELELFGPSSANATFAAGSTGTLKLDSAQSVTGVIAGLASGNYIDLANIAFGTNTTLGYTPNANNTGGTLSVANGSTPLLGNYLASSFVAASDGHGGTLITDPPPTTQVLLTQPQHA